MQKELTSTKQGELFNIEGNVVEQSVSTNRVYTINSFFAGIGGFDLAFENAGAKVVFQCEINKFCRQVLKSHWPEIKLEQDITKIQADDIPDADIWCGGFPCQDVSVARGSKGRDGLKGKNSGLFYPFVDLIKLKKPKVLLIENVEGLLSSHNGQDFRVILETLSNIGYAVAWRIMNSRYFGAPQSRPRVFICAALGNPDLAISSLYETNKGTKPKNKRAGFLAADECQLTGARVAEVAYCLAATSGRHTGTDWSRTYISYHSNVRRLIPDECEGLQGFPVGWTDIIEAKVANLVEKDSARYHALGNAVAVPVVEWIASNILKKLQLEQVKNQMDMLPEILLKKYEDFSGKSRRSLQLSKLHLPTDVEEIKLKWQTGGLVIGDFCWDIKAPEAPSTPIEKKLIEVINKEYPADHYYISAKAAEGILRRVKSQNRTLFQPMQEALIRMVNNVEIAVL